LAILYTAAGQYGALPPQIVYRRVHDLATKALQLHPELPEAHAALGFESLFCHADFAAAEKHFLRALAANRSCIAAQQGYGFLLSASGRHEASIAAMQKAKQMDPLSLMNNVLVASAMCMAGRLQEALLQVRQVIDMEQGFPTGHACEGWILSAMGNHKQALLSFRQAVECCPESPLMLAHLAYGLAAAGNDVEARALMETVIDLRRHSWFSPYWIALIQTALGEVDEALDWLDTAAAERDGWRVFAVADLRTVRFRTQPHFVEWVKRLGLPRENILSQVPATHPELAGALYPTP
jgi:tetratricopeptide (TPR) repeat protein